MKIYAITRDDGGVSIMRLLNEARDIDAEIKRWEAASNLKCVSYREIKEDDLPQDRKHRNSLIDTGKSLALDDVRRREQYAFYRKREYPEPTEAADAFVKQLQYMKKNGIKLHPDAEAYMDKCLKIKAQNPKPGSLK